jgi:hypothetical protein
MNEAPDIPPADPLPEPQPVSADSAVAFASGMAKALIAGGVIFLIVGSKPTPLQGATRSLQLTWQARQSQIAQVVQDDAQGAALAADLDEGPADAR